MGPLYHAHGYYGLGSRLYPSNKRTCSTKTLQSLSRVRYNQASKSKPLLAQGVHEYLVYRIIITKFIPGVP